MTWSFNKYRIWILLFPDDLREEFSEKILYNGESHIPEIINLHYILRMNVCEVWSENIKTESVCTLISRECSGQQAFDNLFLGSLSHVMYTSAMGFQDEWIFETKFDVGLHKTYK
jgi:hypothetical protein